LAQVIDRIENGIVPEGLGGLFFTLLMAIERGSGSLIVETTKETRGNSDIEEKSSKSRISTGLKSL
jgi:hypothetical protein